MTIWVLSVSDRIDTLDTMDTLFDLAPLYTLN